MTWVRKDDRAPWHRKVAPLTDAAYRLWDEALCWSSAYLTDGAVTRADLASISKRGRPKLAEELVKQGLWHAPGDVCDSEHCPADGIDAWVIHDYWEYQPSKAKVLQERDAKAKRQARWLDAKRGARDGARDASHPASHDASKDDAPPRPAPPRREAGRSPVAIADRHPASQGDGDPKCKRHPGELAHNCRGCRSEQLGGVA